MKAGDSLDSEARDRFQREYWKDRAANQKDVNLKSIADPTQRIAEKDFILANIPSGSKVLEIGCGSGYMTEFVATVSDDLFCIDIEQEMIDAAKARVSKESQSGIRWQVCSFHDFPETEKFDVVISSRVFINFPSLSLQKSGLDKVRRLLASGGRFLFLEGHVSAFDFINQAREYLGLEGIQPSPVNLYLNTDFFAHMKKQGFTLETTFENGLYDALTRVLVPALEKAATIHEKQKVAFDWISAVDWRNIESYSRVAGGKFSIFP